MMLSLSRPVCAARRHLTADASLGHAQPDYTRYPPEPKTPAERRLLFEIPDKSIRICGQEHNFRPEVTARRNPA